MTPTELAKLRAECVIIVLVVVAFVWLLFVADRLKRRNRNAR